MTAEQAMNLVKQGITGYSYEGSSMPADNIVGTALEDTVLEWDWTDGYNANIPGEYGVEISYNNVKLGTVKVVVPVREIESISLSNSEKEGSVQRGKTHIYGVTLTVKYKDGGSATIPITTNMLEGTFDNTVLGTYENLKVKYGNLSIDGFTLNVTEGNNYPEYPEEGAVKVNKTATGIDFQASGLAQVEVSASGVPIKKGADLIIMLDTSSSMNSNKVKDENGKDTTQTRLQVLQQSLNSLIAQLKTPGEDGELMDIRVAIADFNGYYDENTGTPYDHDEDDRLGSGSYDQDSKAKVYTGSGNLDKDAFLHVSNESLVSPTLGYTSGTNYDYGFDAIYQLGTAIKAANKAADEERDLYVIFMSDGAAFQWNYYHSRNNHADWGKWITGVHTTENQLKNAVDCDNHIYYYDMIDRDGDGQLNEHRMANAIKGDPNSQYEIIRKTDDGLPNGTLTPVINEDTNRAYENLYTVPGLGATMFTINFDAQTDGSVSQEDISKSLASTASEQKGSTKYYYEVKTAAELNHAFDVIGSEIAYAATNARYVDKMGEHFNLQLKAHTYTKNDGTIKTVNPKIEIISYDIYTKEDGETNRIPTGKNIGDRKGTSKILETVTFSADGTKAYSDLIYTTDVNGNKVYTNILADGTDNKYVKGVIYAKTFIYNTNALDVAVDGVNIPATNGTTNVLPSETFYWKMGTVQSSELAMRYYVYLDGSMEGTREAGAYATNEYAILYYDNYLGNSAQKPTVSPTLSWKSANISYAFYLVNSEGEIIVNQTTGQTGSFANKIAVTNPVVYKEVLLNSDGSVDALDIIADGDNVLPTYYQLYDSDADYTVSINSNGMGSWHITKSPNVGVASTYVTHYKTEDPSEYSNLIEYESNSDDFTHTTVWFAVVWNVQAHPDTVVVDYGLPVDISVLSNDMFGDYGKLAGIGPVSDVNLEGHDTNMPNSFTTSYDDLRYGSANANLKTGKVRYALNKSNGMQMQTYDNFAYAVQYTGANNPGYYYDTVTVIPATTIYYEDDFITYDSFTWDYQANGWTDTDSDSDLWSTVGTVDTETTQDEDRPGQFSLTDANNIYGYDSVNKGMSTYSLGSAKMATVNYDNYAQASFIFWGTGFDVISMTSNMTGTILVDVEKKTGDTWTKFDNYVVDTYYGYTQDADGNWIVNPDAKDCLYQVPVIKMANKEYAQYRVTIKATYDAFFDHVNPSNNEGDYDFYLDAIRIYDPANDGTADQDTVIEDAYKVDGESWPSYVELRNELISAKEFSGTYVEDDAETTDKDKTKKAVQGAVFIDGDSEVVDDEIDKYISYGPNNEVYLKPGQSVAFMLSDVKKDVKDKNGNFVTENGKQVQQSIVKNVHMGIKSADGKSGTYSIFNVAKQDVTNGVDAGAIYNSKSYTIDTTTDMYYNLTGWKNDIVVIKNTGNEGVISLTNIKTTYTSNPADEFVTVLASDDEILDNTEAVVYMTRAAATLTLRSLNAPTVPEQPETPVVPDVPVVPEQPETPVVPDTPVTPEEPETPVVPDEPEVEKPEVEKPAKPTVAPAKVTSVKTDKKTYTQGDSVKVTVTTNDEATKVKVGTKTLKTFKTVKGKKTWTTTVKASKIGKLSVSAVAYNKKGTASKKVTKTVTVKQFAPKKFTTTLSKSKVKKGAKYTVTVKTSTDVKYVKVNGKKITKFKTDKKKTTRTFKITYKATKVGKKTVKVVTYNKAGYASKAKSKTVTVKRK